MERVSDRLILTPALRVAAVPDPRRDAKNPTLDVIAALEVAVGAQGQRWESETGDEAPMAGVDWIDALWDETAEPALRVRQAAAPAPLILGSIRTALPMDVAVEVIEPVGFAKAEPLAEPAWDQDSDRDADLETGEPGLELENESSRFLADPVWVAQAEAEVLAALAGEISGETTEIFTSRRSAAADPQGQAAAGSEATYDEELLRDLVRDLIREELQGSLGERITRNVRKLVRAEIARALAAQACE